MQFIHAGVHLRYGIEIVATSYILLCGGLSPHINHDWGRLWLGVEILVTVEVVLIMEGVTHVSFTGAPRWAPLYLLKKLQTRKTPLLVKVTKGFRICGGLGQTHIGEKLYFEVFSIW